MYLSYIYTMYKSIMFFTLQYYFQHYPYYYSGFLRVICALLLSNNRTLVGALQELQLHINILETSFINKHHGALWLDTGRQLMRQFSPWKHMSVKFANSEDKSEGAIDMGGPKREFSTFIGPEGCKSLFPNSNVKCFVIVLNVMQLLCEARPVKTFSAYAFPPILLTPVRTISHMHAIQNQNKKQRPSHKLILNSF